MSVRFFIPPYLQQYTGGHDTIEANGKTVGDGFREMVRRFPSVEPMIYDKYGKLFSYVGVYVNGEDTYPELLQRRIHDGDEVHVIYIIGGG
jgi:molybdopterin converting factor small subunit